MSNTKALSICYAIHKIEHAPNVRCLVSAYDAAIEGSTLSVHRKRGTEWAVWFGEYAGFSGTFAEVRRHMAAAAEEILDREAADQIASVPAAPVLVQQQAQQQQGRDMRAGKPAAGEVRVAALGHLGSPCDPKSAEASLWIVTDGNVSRDFSSLEEAQLYAEFCEGIGFIPAHEDAPATVKEQAPAAFEPIDFDPSDERPDLVCYSPEHAGVILAGMEAERAGQDPRAAEIAAAAATAALRPKGLPSNGWTNEEIAAVIGPLLEEVEETAVASFDERLRDAATSAVSATKAWLAVHEREVAGEHIPFNVACDARDRLQDCHRAYADTQEIVAIGDVGGDRTLWSHRDGLAVYLDGDDEPMLILPRGVDRTTVRLVLQAYDRAFEVGKHYGRVEIQAGLRQLLNVAAA